MDRLTARDGFGTPYYPYCDNVKGCGGYCAQCNFETKTMDKLAQYEDLAKIYATIISETDKQLSYMSEQIAKELAKESD